MKYSNISSYISEKPILPTYHITDMGIAKVISYWFNPECCCEKTLFQTSDGWCYSDADNYMEDFSALPLHQDTISDEVAYGAYMFFDEDILFTENELKIWGLTKVYLYPFSNEFIDLHEFLEKASSVDNYSILATKEKAAIFGVKDCC